MGFTVLLAHHPRTSEGAFWHKQRYPHQLWLDGVYMGMLPFLAGVGVMEGDDHKVEEAVREFSIARSHLRDPQTGLYYHAWDEAKEQPWADPETGRSRYVWGRGLGWSTRPLLRPGPEVNKRILGALGRAAEYYHVELFAPWPRAAPTGTTKGVGRRCTGRVIDFPIDGCFLASNVWPGS